MTPIRVLVTGGRGFTDESMVVRALDATHAAAGVACVIEGGASGADAFARRWARDKNVPLASFPAEWRRHGKAAGPIRNSHMLTVGRPDLVLAFPGTNGTVDMVRKSKAAGVEVLEFS